MANKPDWREEEEAEKEEEVEEDDEEEEDSAYGHIWRSQKANVGQLGEFGIINLSCQK